MQALSQPVNALLRRLPAWPLYPLGLLPAAWLWYLGLSGGLGPEPIKALEQELGKTALQLLTAGLCVTPLRRFLGVNLIRYRRAIGLLAFYYVLMHLAVWLLLDLGDLGRIWADIVKRPFITLGFAAFVAMLPLALSSNDWAVRRLGALRWQRLHRLVYGIALAGAVHFLWLTKSKAWAVEPWAYLAAIAALLALRLWPKRRRAPA